MRGGELLEPSGPAAARAVARLARTVESPEGLAETARITSISSAAHPPHVRASAESRLQRTIDGRRSLFWQALKPSTLHARCAAVRPAKELAAGVALSTSCATGYASDFLRLV